MTGFARLLGIVVALLVTLAPVASAAPKKPHFYFLGVGDGPAISDGQRHVAFPRHAPSIMYYDFGAEFPHGRLVYAPACATSPSASVLGAVGAGKIGWDCYSGLTPPLFEQVSSGLVSSPIDPAHFPIEADTVRVGAIGTVWARLDFTAYHGHGFVFYELSTGNFRLEVKAASQYENLSDPSLAATMCPPLHRVVAPNDDPYDTGPAYRPYLTRGRSGSA